MGETLSIKIIGFDRRRRVDVSASARSTYNIKKTARMPPPPLPQSRITPDQKDPYSHLLFHNVNRFLFVLFIYLFFFFYLVFVLSAGCLLFDRTMSYLYANTAPETPPPHTLYTPHKSFTSRAAGEPVRFHYLSVSSSSSSSASL